MDIPGSKAVYVSLMILGLLATGIILLTGKLPGLGFAIGTPKLADEPYALDDPVRRSRVGDGSLNARLPERVAFRPRGDGIEFATVMLDIEPDEPGFNSRLRIYQPTGRHGTGSLGCVLVGPAGGTGVTGPVTSGAADEDEWLPYVKAGFAVVAFCQDGEQPRQNPTPAEIAKASTKFFAAQAGLVNARNALEFVLARMSQVDARRIYVAGHSSAATLALLFAEHERRLAGCIAYAPVSNIARRVEQLARSDNIKMTEAERELFRKVSPSTHAGKLNCPVFLFHGLQDQMVPATESRELAGILKELGKRVQLATVPGGDHHGDMIRQGIPSGIEWLEDLEHPETAEQRKRERAAAKAERTAKASGGRRAELASRALAGKCTSWIQAAQSASRQLKQVVDESALDNVTLARLNSSLEGLAGQARAVLVKARQLPVQDDQGPIHTLPVESRDKLVTLNRALAGELDRLRALKAGKLKHGSVLVNLERGLLAESFLEGRFPTPEELAAEHQLEAEYQAARFSAARWVRDFRDEAVWAMRFRQWQDALNLLRADLLVSDDAALVASVKWSPGLGRPAAQLQWAFGAQLEGFPGAGPPNLRPPPGPLKKGTRGTGADWKLGRQLKWLTGNIGLWLAEGLQSRVEAGSFGDWAQDGHRSVFEHPGIVVLDFAPVDRLLAEAAAQNADVLMAVLLTNSGRDSRSVTRMSVRVYDVESGAMLWESKPITNTQIESARRRGDQLDSKFTEAVLARIDDEIVLREVPTPDEASVKKRLAALAATAPAEPLEALVELRYYQLKKLIPDDVAQDQIAKILGLEDARRLVSDDEDERRRAIGKLVPKGR